MRHVVSGIRSTPESAVAIVEILSKAFSKFKSEKGSLVPQATSTKLPGLPDEPDREGGERQCPTEHKSERLR
jgi:hypothetical protein